MNKLLVAIQSSQPTSFSSRRPIRIGSGPDCNVVIDDPAVSNEHASISWNGAQWIWTDSSSQVTYLDGQRVTELPISRGLDLHLSSPDGPLVRVEPLGTTVDDPTAGNQVGGMRALLPFRGCLKKTRQAPAIHRAFFVFALIPTIMLVLLKTRSSLELIAWAFTLYFATVWALVLWFLIKPGRLNPVLTVVIPVFTAVAGMPLVLLVEPTHASGLWQNILGVGVPEETAKALPVLLFMLVLARAKRYSPRMCMYMGVLSGLTFGVIESVGYALGAAGRGATPTSFALQVLYRLTADSVEHAVWAGISAFFIGLAIRSGRRKTVLAMTGLVIAAVLHGVFDSFGGAVSWGGAITMGVSLFVFLGYAMTADVQAVHPDPLFSGEPMMSDPPHSLSSVEVRS